MPLFEPRVEPDVNCFRLTGVSATPVMTADNNALNTIYLTPYTGNRIALYNGVSWDTVYGAEVSLAVTGRTTDLPFDIFAYNNAGVLALEFLNWSNATARATGLTRVDGVWTKSGDATRRYVGSCRPRSATSYSWVAVGVNAPSRLDLWNYSNRLRTSWQVSTSTDSWNYTSATWRQAQGSTNYQVDLMCGVQESSFEGRLIVSSSNSSAITPCSRECGFGFDTATASSGLNGSVYANDDFAYEHTALITLQVPIGRHFVAWVEISNASTGVTTWYGDNGASRVLSGMAGGWFT